MMLGLWKKKRCAKAPVSYGGVFQKAWLRLKHLKEKIEPIAVANKVCKAVSLQKLKKFCKSTMGKITAPLNGVF